MSHPKKAKAESQSLVEQNNWNSKWWKDELEVNDEKHLGN